MIHCTSIVQELLRLKVVISVGLFQDYPFSITFIIENALKQTLPWHIQKSLLYYKVSRLLKGFVKISGWTTLHWGRLLQRQGTCKFFDDSHDGHCFTVPLLQHSHAVHSHILDLAEVNRSHNHCFLLRVCLETFDVLFIVPLAVQISLFCFASQSNFWLIVV